jgi:hypothetical protein
VRCADRYARHGNAHKAAAHFKRARLRFGGDGPACFVCLDSDPPPIQSGCACRSDTGLAHVDCLAESAAAQQPHRGKKVWWECQTCGQQFTAAMRTGLAEAWWSRASNQAHNSDERLCAASTLAQARLLDGRYAESERIIREVLGVQRRSMGEQATQLASRRFEHAKTAPLATLSRFAETSSVTLQALHLCV